MVSSDTIRTAIGVIGNGTALVLFLSPVPTFIRIWKKGSVEQYSPIPYVATLLNCMMWVLYGLPLVHPHSMLVITINGTGMLIQLLLYAIYYKNTQKIVEARKRKAGQVAMTEVVVDGSRASNNNNNGGSGTY
ncbi:sugars will eventually be exported transporter4b [Zea mays]|uniref:Sugars will eventually be exported transporter4b n=1 Tax=Zea mays TaxID=4577 RepID=A0A1D6H4K6_MAIZE|nr:sugars will eventually be exported transporter4b [Zea mays]